MDAPTPLPNIATSRSSEVGIGRAVSWAVVLALLSVLPVAWSLLLQPSQTALSNAGWAQGPIDWQPIPPISAVALSLGVVVPSAFVGGFAGGVIWRWSRLGGASVALASGWALGVVTLPIAAATLGIHVRTAIACVMGCESLLRDDRPLLGAIAYVEFLLADGLILSSLALPALILIFVVFILPSWVRGRPAARPRLPLRRSVIAFATLHGIALVWIAGTNPGGLVPYLSLTVGVVVWATWMDSGHAPRLLQSSRE